MNIQIPFPISYDELRLAQERTAPFVRRTPLLDCIDLLVECGGTAKLKLENLQVTGSFKIRGATNKLLTLSEEERSRGVVTVSSGNHGRAVSYAAGQLGIRAFIFLPETVPQNKVSSIRNLGAEVIVRGRTYDETDGYAHDFQQRENLTFIHPFDDLTVIAGQGTIGLELLEDFPEIDTVIVPLSGGGLLSGIVLALKSKNPKLRAIGVTMERGAAMVESLKAGKVVDIVEEPTLADALAGGIGLENRFTFKMIRELMDEAVFVSEEEIARAMTFALERYRLVIEGGGAVGLAAILGNKIRKAGGNIAIVISGGNIEIASLAKIYQENIANITGT
jgi:threonine dehydratase